MRIYTFVPVADVTSVYTATVGGLRAAFTKVYIRNRDWDVGALVLGMGLLGVPVWQITLNAYRGCYIRVHRDSRRPPCRLHLR